MTGIPWTLSPDRCFDADPAQRTVARELYATVKDLPIVSPHGHVPPALLADPAARLGTPADLFIIPDHYVFRMLYSQGVALEDLGVPARDGTPVETDHRRIWQRFAEHFYLFRGTPTGLWLADELVNLFGVQERLNGESARAHLRPPGSATGPPGVRAARPAGALQDRAALHHRRRDRHARTTTAGCTPTGCATSGPTFRPDAVVNITSPAWREQIAALSARVGRRRGRLRQLHPGAGAAARGLQGAGRAGDRPRRDDPLHRAPERGGGRRDLRAGPARPGHGGRRGALHRAHADRVRPHERRGWAGDAAARRQLARPQRRAVSRASGRIRAPTSRSPPSGRAICSPLLNEWGNDPRFRLILFTLDESTYSRELAPLAGHYPALLLGPPWWFFDSVNGMRRYFDAGDRDRRAVQHGRLQRRHAGLCLDPRRATTCGGG